MVVTAVRETSHSRFGGAFLPPIKTPNGPERFCQLLPGLLYPAFWLQTRHACFNLNPRDSTVHALPAVCHGRLIPVIHTSAI